MQKVGPMTAEFTPRENKPKYVKSTYVPPHQRNSTASKFESNKIGGKKHNEYTQSYKLGFSISLKFGKLDLGVINFGVSRWVLDMTHQKALGPHFLVWFIVFECFLSRVGLKPFVSRKRKQTAGTIVQINHRGDRTLAPRTTKQLNPLSAAGIRKSNLKKRKLRKSSSNHTASSSWQIYHLPCVPLLALLVRSNIFTRH